MLQEFVIVLVAAHQTPSNSCYHRELTMPQNNIIGSFNTFDQWWAQQTPQARRLFRALPRVAQVRLLRQVVQPDSDQVVNRRLVIQRLNGGQQLAHAG